MKRKIIQIWACGMVGLGLYATPVNAQKLDVEWVTPISGSGRFIVTSEATLDPNGNLFAVGSFKDSIEVTTTSGPVKIDAGNSEDMFVCKMNPSGAIEWIKQIGGRDVLGNVSSGSSDQFANHYFSIVSDVNGDVYIAGNFKDTVDFDPGVGEFKLSTGSYLGGAFPGQTPPTLFYENGFILKLSNDGEFRWVRMLAGKGNSISGIAIDKNSRTLAVTGYFQDTLDFNNQLGTDLVVANPPGRNVFVAKYDTAGQFIWARNMGGGNNGTGTRNEGNAISINNEGYIFTTGVFRDSADFDPGPGVHLLRSAVRPAENIFVSKLDSNGNHVWARAMGGVVGSSGARGSAIATDNSGNVLTTGYFQGTGSFDPTTNTTIFGTSNLSMFVSKLDANGNYVWSKSFERPTGTSFAGVDHGTSIAVDQNDAVYAFGYFYGGIFLDPDHSKLNRDTFKSAVSVPDPMLVKLDAGGSFEWGRTIRTTGNSRGYHVLVPRSQEVYLTGNFTGAAEFNPDAPNPFSFNSANATEADGFILKLFCVDTSSGRVTLEVCGSSTEYNGVTYTSSGTYTQHLFNVLGCDSTLTIQLTLNPVVKPEIVVNGQELSTSVAYKTYQWIRNGVKIDGATNATYTVEDNGNFQVAVTTNEDCPDTSDIYTITNVSVDQMPGQANLLSIYPNPVKDRIFIDAAFEFEAQILSVDGKLLRTEKGMKSVSVQDLAPGLYFIKITNQEGKLIKTAKFTKE